MVEALRNGPRTGLGAPVASFFVETSHKGRLDERQTAQSLLHFFAESINLIAAMQKAKRTPVKLVVLELA
jgi:hypothetical protein